MHFTIERAIMSNVL